MINWLVYDLLLLNGEEQIKETKALSMIFTWNILNISRKGNKVIVSNNENWSEVFAELLISSENTDKKSNVVLILNRDFNHYQKSWVPHWEK